MLHVFLFLLKIILMIDVVLSELFDESDDLLLVISCTDPCVVEEIEVLEDRVDIILDDVFKDCDIILLLYCMVIQIYRAVCRIQLQERG